MSPKVDEEFTQLRIFSELRFAQSLLIPFFISTGSIFPRHHWCILSSLSHRLSTSGSFRPSEISSVRALESSGRDQGGGFVGLYSSIVIDVAGRYVICVYLYTYNMNI